MSNVIDNEKNMGKDIIGCVGKLPVQAEFIRCNVINQNLKQLDHWLQDGFIHTSRDQLIRQQNFQVSELAQGLLLNYSLGRKPVIGYLTDSHDSYGRSYPLLLFREVHNIEITQNQSGIPYLYQLVYQNFDALIKKSWENKTHADFIGQLISDQSALPPCDSALMVPSIKDILSSISYQSFWQQIMGLQSFRHASQLLAKIIKIVTKIPSQETWQINFPIAKSQPIFISISFWLSLLEALKVFNYRNMHIAWSMKNEEKQRYLMVYHGNLNVAFFRTLIDKQDIRITYIDPLKDYLTDSSLDLDNYEFAPSENLQTIIETICKLHKPKNHSVKDE